MALPKRTDPLPDLPAAGAASPWGLGAEDRAVGGDYAVGGQVGQMHAELAQRLARGLAAPVAPAPPHERVVRFLSVAGGFAALVAAYAGIAFAILR